MYFIGFDIGGTKIEAMLLQFTKDRLDQSPIPRLEYQQSNGEIINTYVLHKKRKPTDRQLGYMQTLDKMASLVKEVCEESGLKQDSLAGIGLSIPGPVDPITNVVKMSNTMIFAGHNIRDDLYKKLNLVCPIHAENDANCFALAEVLCGAGVDYFKQSKISVSEQVAIGLIIGSGFGGGIIINGKVLPGRRGGGGEVGHMTLYPHGNPCYCGRSGCAEQYLCGPAFEAALNARLYSQIPKRPSASEIFELYRAKDPIAMGVVKQYKKDLARFLGSLTCFMDPHYFVLGGGLSLQDIIYEELEILVGRHTYSPNEPIPVFKHKIGDSSGAIGAVLNVLKKNNILF